MFYTVYNISYTMTVNSNENNNSIFENNLNTPNNSMSNF